jgi:hypothetical protein
MALIDFDPLILPSGLVAVAARAVGCMLQASTAVVLQAFEVGVTSASDACSAGCCVVLLGLCSYMCLGIFYSLLLGGFVVLISCYARESIRSSSSKVASLHHACTEQK